jgi:hypothetical protein
MPKLIKKNVSMKLKTLIYYRKIKYDSGSNEGKPKSSDPRTPSYYNDSTVVFT